MASKTEKSIGRFSSTAAARAKSPTRSGKATAKKSGAPSHQQMLANAKKSRPPQSWFDEDFSKLRGPKA